MKFNSKAVSKIAVLAAVVLFLVTGIAVAQTTVNLTAQRTTTTLPDGKVVPMWGFVCNNSATGVTPGACASLNAAATGWSPVLLTVPAGAGGTPSASLTINLANTLPTPTSLVIVGQIGGNLGSPVKVASPPHATQNVTTWPSNAAATFTPPVQAPRAESFVQEAAASTGAQTYTWTALRPGTYLIESGTHPSIQGPMGLYGVLVVTQAPTTTASGVAYPNVSYDADAIALLSEIDPVQNAAVDAVAATAVAASSVINETLPFSPACAYPASTAPTCYPPAVNYTPLYYLINGKSYDKSNPANSALSVPATYLGGNVLLRFVNAGLRMHVPSVVGLDMSLIAEDGNVLPGNPKVQNEVFLAAGKVYDVVVKPAFTAATTSAPASFNATTYPIFDRELSLSANNQPDGGMYAILQIAGATITTPTAQAVSDAFSVSVGETVTGNVISNDSNVVNAAVVGTAPAGLTFNSDGSFSYTAGTTAGTVTFSYNGNGGTTNTALVTITVVGLQPPTAVADNYTANNASTLVVSRGLGVLANDNSPGNYPLKAVFDACGTSSTNCLSPIPSTGGTGVTLNPDGSFTANVSSPGTYSFNYHAVNSQGASSSSVAVSVTFPKGSGLAVTIKDAQSLSPVAITDYSWVIEEDDTMHTAPGVSTGPSVPSLATSFHRAHMPVIATGCTGPISCGSGQTVYDANPASATFGQHVPLAAQPVSTPDQVVLDPTKYYYISVLPGDAANPFVNGGGGPVPVDPNNPNGPQRQFDLTKDCDFTIGTGSCGHTIGGTSVAPGQLTATILVEPSPLPPAQLRIFVFEDNNPTNGDIDGVEQNQGLGGFSIILNDVAAQTGDPTGQMTYDMFNMPLTNALANAVDTATGLNMCPITSDPNNLMGMVITCPEVESDGKTPSPVAGQAIIKNLFPNRFDVIANPGAAREAAGEQWIQVSTLEGARPQDAFAKNGEPGYFQEFGPPGFHAFIGFINPAHIQAVNKALGGTNSITGKVTMLHMSRPSNEMLYDSNSYDTLAQSTCYVGLNSSAGTGADIAFAQCQPDGSFTLTGVPAGTFQIVVWDQWLNQIIDYKTVTVPSGSTGTTIAAGDIPVFSWFTRVETSEYLDLNQNGTRDGDEPGLSQIPMRIRYRDGSVSNFLATDTNGVAPFDSLFPLFNWYVIESDTTRYKGTGVHIAVDGGGAVDSTGIYQGVLASTYPTGGSSVRTDPGTTLSEGIQSFISQSILMDWGKTQYAVGENGGITGHVIYASTRPFDDPTLGFQNTWEPLVPNVTVNLYQETTAPDGTQGLTLVDTTLTSSWDDYVNGSTNGVPNMTCPGQLTTDPYYTYSLANLPGGATRCYDGFHNWNQAQPAPFDGQYVFPTTACTVCKANPATSNPISPNVLPAGKYVVEVVVPPGYEIVKEEDKNILIGDGYIAPVTQQFAGLANIFIVPDQAAINAYYNANNTNNATTNLGRTSFANFGPGGIGIQNTPCVGQMRVVPDYLSLFPGSGEVAPFAGATRPLCDRREVTLDDQMASGADFLIFTPTPIASHFSGMILDDASSEFNITSPDFGEKFAVPFVPVSFRDFNGVEISRTYSDQYGMFNGMTFSSWAVNPPNPTGYAPNMMITCMNDPGPIPDPAHPGQLITDPMYNPNYSNFCYTNPFMPGVTDYMDTPVLPVAAFASGYNPVDCAYPDTTPAIARVDTSDATFGPWLSAAGPTHTITITGLGDQTVPNNAYSGPSAYTGGIASQKTITRHYGFGAQCTSPSSSSATCNTLSRVTLGGVPLAITSWSDTSIVATAPVGTQTGELVITAGNGKKSVDTVTVTVGGKAPTYVTPATSANTAGLPHPIQDAVDAAAPGDLIMLGPGTYPELVVMWKPVRLQGVGAASVIINAAKYPTQKLESWRTKINSLFGLDSQGNTLPGAAQVDPLPGQEITGGVILLEPSVLGTEEGAGVTVVAKNLPATACGTAVTGSASNFRCAPSSIDGISITGGDGGGGIYVNGWAHNLQIANNRVYGNAGTFSGGVRIGQPYLEGQALIRGRGNQYLGFGYDTNVNIHHNKITNNGTVEANNGEAGGGGGLSLCSGTDNYAVNYNFICGNYSLGDGGGIGHVGVSLNGKITNNVVIFNQVFNQSSNTSGGGIVIEGEPSTAGGLTLGTGSVTLDSNLIQGNHAQGGHGGGIRLQNVNGQDVQLNPSAPGFWWQVNLTNNMIVNNVAGWSGGGISMSDTVHSQFFFNTVASNDSTATVGSVFTNVCPANALQPAGFATGPTVSCAQPAGISSELNSPALCIALAGAPVPFRCGGTGSHPYSNPSMIGDIVYQNRSFYFRAGTTSTTNGTTATALIPTLTQTAVGQCPTGANYWDLGVLGQPQTGATQLLNPTYSVLTPGTTGYASTNLLTNPQNVTQYCNGSRIDPGMPDADPSAPPVQFTMQAAATEDEGGNWIDVRYGPLSLSNSAAYTAAGVNLPPVGDYHLASTSPAINSVSCLVAGILGVTNDFDGQPRPMPSCFTNPNAFDRGADEYPAPTPGASVSTNSLSFGNQGVGTTSAPELVALTNTGTAALSINSIGIAGFNAGNFAQTNNCGGSLAAGSVCTISVTFTPNATGNRTATLFINDNAGGSPQTVALSGVGTGAQQAVFPFSLTFGSARNAIARGTTSGAQTVTLRNTGNVGMTGITLAFTVSTSGASATDFHRSTTNPGTCGTTLAAGTSCTINVVFAPATTDTTSPNPKLGSMRVSSSAFNSPQSVSLTGYLR